MLVPLFSITQEDWRHTLQYFFQMLVNWVGKREVLEDLLLRLPCGLQAKEEMQREVREDCHDNLHR